MGIRSVKRINRSRATVVAAREDAQRTLTTFLAGQAPDMAAQITTARDATVKLARVMKADGSAEPVPTADPDDVEAIARSLDFSSWADLVQRLGPSLVSVSQDGITAAFDQIDVKPTSDIVNPVNQDAVDYARDRSADLVGMRFDDDGNLIQNPDASFAITESTRQMLRGDIARAIESGTSTADLATELAAAYAFSAARAEMIARTEIANADVQGNLMAYRGSGVVSGKRWLLGSEHDEPDECDDAADMGVVPLDDDFGGIGDPPAHPNCVCDISPVLDKGDDE